MVKLIKQGGKWEGALNALLYSLESYTLLCKQFDSSHCKRSYSSNCNLTVQTVSDLTFRNAAWLHEKQAHSHRGWGPYKSSLNFISCHIVKELNKIKAKNLNDVSHLSIKLPGERLVEIS